MDAEQWVEWMDGGKNGMNSDSDMICDTKRWRMYMQKKCFGMSERHVINQ